jgi:hypothetical protein
MGSTCVLVGTSCVIRPWIRLPVFRSDRVGTSQPRAGHDATGARQLRAERMLRASEWSMRRASERVRSERGWLGVASIPYPRPRTKESRKVNSVRIWRVPWQHDWCPASLLRTLPAMHALRLRARSF